ncbi:MAG: cobalamin biosynthesis protein CobQ [Patescibacteria group bacterium]|nr:cobalamin biosynthesis protein CobQ [Patescibacteria group bacterium]
MKLLTGWLYPDLMSTYGDRGNVICLQKRCEWRGIEAQILPIEVETSLSELEKVDLIMGGGSQDRQQEIVMRDLKGVKGKTIKKMIENDKPGIFTCGAPQLLGHYYEPAIGQRIEGLGIFDMVSVCPGPDKPRCIGNIVVETNKNYNIYNDYNSYNNYLVGFENHGGRTYLGKNIAPLAKVIRGFGNNGEDKTEGAVYKNAVATYLHGPVLPKNPHLADWLIKTALEVKYGKKIKLERLDDDLERHAHDFIIKKILANK